MINYLDKFSLKNKVVFITGGLGLIGGETSKALASAGAKTIILDIDKAKGVGLEEEIRGSGFEADYQYFDITELTSLKKNINKLVERYQAIDVWVNAAYPRTEDWGKNPLQEQSLDSWRKNLDMHLSSYAWASREAALAMRRQKAQGSIINFSSIYGVLGNDLTIYENLPINHEMAYSTIKGGIISLTRFLASHFGGEGIRINNICPGGIFDDQDKIFVRNYEKKVPLKRMGRPEDIASAVLFLASEAASYITGATIMVDGGWTIV